MTIILKEEYKNDSFIKELNEELCHQYGANTYPKFNPWYELEEEANYMNKHPEGKKQLKDWKRPITAQQLSSNFFWLTNDVFSIKLSGGITAEEGKDAVAVCKWILKTKGRYINKSLSDHYDKKTVSEYLNRAFEEAGYHLVDLWKL